MENALKFVGFIVGILILVFGINYVQNIMNSASRVGSDGANQLNGQFSALSDMDKTFYDKATLSGSDVIQAIQKYGEAQDLFIIVSTKGDGKACNFIYNNDFATQLGKAAAGTNSQEAQKQLWERYITNNGQQIIGWPQHDANNKALVTEDKKDSDDGDDKQSVVWSDLKPSTCSIANGGPDKIFTKGYDSTKTSIDPGYISLSASFSSTIQRNQNGDIRYITFVQK